MEKSRIETITSANAVRYFLVQKRLLMNKRSTVVLNYGEDRAMVTYPGAMKYLTLHDIPDAALTTCRHLHLSSIFLQPGIAKDLTALFRKGF